MSDNKHTADDLLALLRTKYAPPAFALVSEVPNATSLNKSRSCDAMAFGCWKSEGILVHGFEIKVSRSDWLKELQDRSKSAAFEPFCHHWWIVAAPKVVQLEELPSAWGLMEPSGNGLRVRSAPDLRTPQPVSTQMLAAFLRRACAQSATQAEIKAAHDAGYREGHARGDAIRDGKQERLVIERDRYKQLAEELQKSIDEFTAASGVRIYGYSGGYCGKELAAFRQLMDHNTHTDLHNIGLAAKQLSECAETLLAAMQAVGSGTNQG